MGRLGDRTRRFSRRRRCNFIDFVVFPTPRFLLITFPPLRVARPDLSMSIQFGTTPLNIVNLLATSPGFISLRHRLSTGTLSNVLDPSPLLAAIASLLLLRAL